MNFKTLAIHAGHDPQEHMGAVMPPIYQTSTFAFRDVGQPGPYNYSRSGNPTRAALETCLAQLEGGAAGFAFATGMAAETTLLMMFSPGDHILVQEDHYGGTYRIFSAVFASKQIGAQFINMRDLAQVKSALARGPKAVWVESPSNPVMNLVDIHAVSELAHQHGALVVCDNTFLSPYFQNPLELGADIVLHSTTKYINGHSDVLGGALILKDAALADKIKYLQNALGTGAGPNDSFLILRGVKTLAVRMEEHHRNALEIARWLEKHPAVSQVRHPGLESHPQHELAKRQMRGCGGTFSFRLRGGEAAVKRLLGRCRIFTLAESLGGVESLIEQPCTMTHASVPCEVQERMGVTPDLVRISVGLEDVRDLIADLEQAL